MEATQTQAVLRTLLVSDLVDSTLMVAELGDKVAARLGRRLDRLARDALAVHEGREIDKTDGFLLLFEGSLNAVRYALDYHAALRRLSEEVGRPIAARVGIHVGEVVLRENPADDVARGAKPLEVEGLAKPVAARLMSLAQGGQTLLTRGAFDVARHGAVGVLEEQKLAWLAHGGYLFKGVPDPVDVFEVGREGEAPLAPPEGSEKVKRVVEQKTLTGWRPAPGLAIPRRRHWRVERRLGEGGFGESWLAVHEKTGDRRVFKFCYDAARLKSLQREITLFRLLKEELGERDDISRILDWSFDEAPFFIESEYTDGGNLADWAEGQGGLAEVPLSVRVEIVAQVATALSAAHSVGVLHKDVKPSNVLIAEGSRGEVRAQLSDFGVGAVTEATRLAEAGITVLGLTERTEEGGTRLYAAPEILEGKPATLQADVYALGVMLYQVVVGDLTRALAPGWRRDVTDELLREDVAAAVDGSPERRLGNALRLAERLRSLESRRKEREAERREREEAARLRATLEKARRRRRVLAVAVVVFALFAGVMAIMTVRVRHEAERAQREAERTLQVATFLQELFEVADPFGTSDPSAARGTSMTARELLDRGREKLETAFEGDPRTLARLKGTLGVIYRNLGHFEEAQPLLEDALDLRRQLLEEHPDIATSLGNLALLLLRKGDYEGAEPLFRESLEMRRRLLGDEHPDIADSLNNLASLLQVKGDYEGAEPFYRESLEMTRRLFGDEHPDIATTLGNLAGTLVSKGDYEGAEPLYRETLEMLLRLLGDEHPYIATTLNSLAWLLHSKGDYEGAEPLYRESLEMMRRLLGDEHPSIADSLHNLAGLLQSKGDYEGAEPLFRESLEMRRRLFGDEHPDIASSLNSLAFLLHSKGDYEGAEPLYRESLEMRRRLLGDEHPYIASSLSNLARLRLARGQPAEAEDLLREALEIFRQALPPEHWRIANAESILGESLAARGSYEEAEPLLLTSYPVVRDKTGRGSTYTRDVLERLVDLYDAWGKAEEAAEYRALWVEAGGERDGA